MGNLCGKEATPDPFAENARPLPANSPARQNQSSSVPRRVGGPPRTLGSSVPGTQSASQQEDARRKAAEAAEARAKSASAAPKGKLASRLQEQKKQTRVDTLSAVSREERDMRDADAGAMTRAYN